MLIEPDLEISRLYSCPVDTSYYSHQYANAVVGKEPELHRLIARGNVVMYRKLTDWPAIISRCQSHPQEALWLDRRNRTALHSACTKRPTVDAILALVNACGGSQIVARPDKHGRTPLVLAIESGSPEAVVKLLLDIHPQAASKLDQFGYLPLHRACYNRTTSDAIVRILLECYPEGASKEIATSKNVMTAGGWGTSWNGSISSLPTLPLDLAIESGASEGVIRMLVTAYPDSVSAKRFGRDGITPLLAAVRRHASPQTINALLAANPEQAFVVTRAKSNLPLHEAIEQNASVSVIKMLLNTNPEAAMQPNRFHATPLHLAIKSMSSLDVVKLLLNRAPQVARMTYSRVKSPLEMSAEEFNKATANIAAVSDASELVGPIGASWERFLLLLRAAYQDLMGQTVDEDGDQGGEWHVLHAAVSFNVPNKLLQTILLLYPHQISQVDKLGRTPLSIAADSGMEWDNGLRTLFDAFPDAIWKTDASTGLHVFMSAAIRKQNRLHTKPLSQLNTVYELLLAGPDMRYVEKLLYHPEFLVMKNIMFC